MPLGKDVVRIQRKLAKGHVSLFLEYDVYEGMDRERGQKAHRERERESM